MSSTREPERPEVTSTMSVTSQDVARLAGVSQPTVSRALRDGRGVAPHTRERVAMAARELGYVPGRPGRAPSPRRTRLIGLAGLDLGDPFATALLGSVDEAVGRHGYRTVLIPARPGLAAPAETVTDGSVDGVVLASPDVGEGLARGLSAAGVPFVTVGHTAGDADACTVDDRLGGELVARFLVELGHRRLGAITGPVASGPVHADRLEAFRRELGRRGVGLPDSRVVHGDPTAAGGRRALLDLLARPEPPTAVFCGTDAIAVGALDAAASLRLEVPDGLTVVGFDDVAFASWDRFDLSTVHTGRERMAAEAVELLVARLDAPDGPARRTVLTPRLALRGTHGPPGSPSGPDTGAGARPPVWAGSASVRPWMAAVSDIARAVTAARPIDVLLTKVAERACALIGFDYCAVMLADDAGERVSIAGWHGLSSDYLALVNTEEALQTHPSGAEHDTPAARAYRECRTVAVSDVRAAEGYGRLQRLAPAQGYRSLVASPLQSSGSVHGLLVGYRNEPHTFAPPEIEFVDLLAEQTAIALQSARLRRTQEEAIDALTDVNAELRRGREQLDRAEQQHRRLMQLVLDDRGLDDVTDALAEMLDASITVEGAGGAVLAAAGQDADISTLAREHASDLPAVAEGYEVVQVPGPAGRTWMAPVVLAGEMVGRLWVTGLRSDLDPLQRRAIERFALVVGVEVLKHRHLLEVQERLSGDLFADLFRPDGIAQPTATLDRAAALGLTLSAPHWLAVVLADSPLPTPGQLAGPIRSAVGRGSTVTIGRYGKTAVLLLPDGADPWTAVQRFQQAVAAAVAPAPAVGVLGPLVHELSGYESAYRLAANAARLRAASGRAGVLDLRSPGITSLLLRDDTSGPDLHRFAEDRLLELRRHDRRRQTDLVGTLRVWLDCGCSTSASARELVVHVNTVAYRLGRIESLTGRDLDRFDVRLEFQLALLVQDVMQLGDG